ncbi:hypothetical protein [Frankia sp. CcWB2]
MRLQSYTIPGVGYTLGFNNAKPVLKDAAVRKAVRGKASLAAQRVIHALCSILIAGRLLLW